MIRFPKPFLHRSLIPFRSFSTPIDLYNSNIQKGTLRDDPYQRKIITNLSNLHDKLTNYIPPKVIQPLVDELTPKTGLSKWFSQLKPNKSRDLSQLLQQENAIRGIYLYGDVGCGKTMLMDLFYNSIPDHLPKTRLHFHQFMQHLHKRSHQLKLKYHKDLDVIPLLASEIASNSTVLCFDEFQVTDVADAMLLRRLLMLLLHEDYGVVLFATSNRAPDDLYLNGIQRESFIPCIKLIKRQTKVVYLNSPTDYRKIPRPMSSVYKYPKPGVGYNSKLFTPAKQKHVDQWFEYFNRDNDNSQIVEDFSLNVWGRQLHVPKSSPPYVAQFTFEELCGKPLAAGDYLTLAASFKAFIITDIPYLSVDVRDKVRRFITFLDAIYDSYGKLAVTAAAPFQDLFVEPEDLQKGRFQLSSEESFDDDELVQKHGFDKSIAKKASMFVNDEEKFAFARALSRLSQMSTTEWLEREQ